MSHQIKTEKKELLKIIIDESRHRPIVPFVGSGISVSAGYPTIRLVIQYLAKVDFAIRFGVFQDRFPLVKDGQQDLVDHYRKHPSKYLEDFGWPNLGELDADLWRWLNDDRRSSLRIEIPDIETEGHYRIWDESLKRHIKNQYPIISDLIFNVLELIENGELIDENDISKLLEKYRKEIIRFLDESFKEYIKNQYPKVSDLIFNALELIKKGELNDENDISKHLEKYRKAELIDENRILKLVEKYRVELIDENDKMAFQNFLKHIGKNQIMILKS